MPRLLLKNNFFIVRKFNRLIFSCFFETCWGLKEVADGFGLVDAFSHIQLGFLQVGAHVA